MVCLKCDHILSRHDGYFRIIKKAYCWHCGRTWSACYNEAGWLVGWETVYSDEEWQKHKEQYRAEIKRVNEELAKRGRKNEPGGCGNCSPEGD
ncbi:MAG: hypothetical protein MUC28_02540 [Planctomycetes bacterium]|jgi:hypothetical protein|nr:hypothetical protein [Planctomycetota bacterium]